MIAQLSRWLAAAGAALSQALELALWPALLSALFAASAHAQEFAPPANDGWVTDRAGVLQPAQERALEGQLEALRQSSSNEIAVLVLANLEGQPIERVALEAGRKWKVGAAGKNNGVVIAVAIAERKVRIEVGSGLEGELTDAKSGRIIREVITPRFRAGDYYGGLRDAVAAVGAVLSGEPLPARSRGDPPAEALFGLIAAFVIVMIVLALASRRGGRGGRGGGDSSVLPWLLAGHVLGGGGRGGGGGGGGFGGGGFGGFGGGGGFSGGGASGGW